MYIKRFTGRGSPSVVPRRFVTRLQQPLWSSCLVNHCSSGYATHSSYQQGRHNPDIAKPISLGTISEQHHAHHGLKLHTQHTHTCSIPTCATQASADRPVHVTICLPDTGSKPPAAQHNSTLCYHTIVCMKSLWDWPEHTTTAAAVAEQQPLTTFRLLVLDCNQHWPCTL